MASPAFAMNGIVCTFEEYSRSLQDPSLHCLTRGQSIGLTLIVEAGFVSLIAVLYVSMIIFRNIARRIRETRGQKWRIFEEPLDIVMSSLFLADAVQAIGAVMSIRWIGTGKVEVGGYCTAQGVIQQLGETGVAISTLVIAVYTFIGIWFGRTVRSIWKTRAVVCAIWAFVIMMVVVGNTVNIKKSPQHQYETPTPYWCWIGQNYLQYRIWGEYFWFWLTLALSIFVYIPLYFWSRGNIKFHEVSWWRFTIQARPTDSSEDLTGVRHRSSMMLLYPLIYCVVVLPLSVVRWIAFFQERGGRQSHVGSAATLAVCAIYSLSGACNVGLLLTTRPDTVLFGKRPKRTRAPLPQVNNRQKTLEDSDVEVNEVNDNELGHLPSR